MILDAINAYDSAWLTAHAKDGSIQLGLYWGTLSLYLDFKGSAAGADRIEVFQGQG